MGRTIFVGADPFDCLHEVVVRELGPVSSSPPNGVKAATANALQLVAYRQSDARKEPGRAEMKWRETVTAMAPSA